MNKKAIIGIALAFLLLVAIRFTYAFFSEEVEGEGTDQVVETGTLSLVYKDGPEITLGNAVPGSSVEKVFTVTNTGTLDTEYSIDFINLINTITNNELVVSYTCTSYTGYVDADNKGTVSGVCEGITNQVIEETEESISSTITNNISIASNITHEYTLTITFIEINEVQDYNQGKSFSATININSLNSYKVNIEVVNGTASKSSVLIGHDSNYTVIVEPDANYLLEGATFTCSEGISGSLNSSTGEFVMSSVKNEGTCTITLYTRVNVDMKTLTYSCQSGASYSISSDNVVTFRTSAIDNYCTFSKKLSTMEVSIDVINNGTRTAFTVPDITYVVGSKSYVLHYHLYGTGIAQYASHYGYTVKAGNMAVCIGGDIHNTSTSYTCKNYITNAPWGSYTTYKAVVSGTTFTLYAGNSIIFSTTVAEGSKITSIGANLTYGWSNNGQFTGSAKNLIYVG